MATAQQAAAIPRTRASIEPPGKRVRPTGHAPEAREERTRSQPRLYLVPPCATCLTELPPVEQDELDRGTAGASAAREWTRRHQRREAQIRQQHTRLGGLILALSSDPSSTTAWARGARGEQVKGESLDKLRASGIAVLHDRRIPGSRANIDHLVISPAGVFVVDTKNYRGRVEKRDVGGLFRTDERLYVNGRDQTKLVTAMERQVAAVKAALAPHDHRTDVPVTAALLFMADDNWSLFDVRPLRFGSVYVLWGKALGKLIRAKPVSPQTDVGEVERALALALPAA